MSLIGVILMATKPRKYMWVNRSYLGIGLEPLDILMLAKIEEDNVNGRACCLTNNEFADMFNETTYAIKKSLSNLENKGMILKRLYYAKGMGRGNRKRDLIVNNDIGSKLYEGYTD